MQAGAKERETGRVVEADEVTLACSVEELRSLARFFSDAVANVPREVDLEGEELVCMRYADSSSEGSLEDAALMLVVRLVQQ